MDELTPEQIDAVLEMLKSHGVEKFEGLGFSVCFGPKAYEQPEQKNDRVPVPKPRSNWEDPGLWPGGEVPTFPVAKRTK